MSTESAATYKEIEKAYGEGDFDRALDIAKELAQELSKNQAKANEDSISDRLLLITGHIYLYGLNQPKEAQAMYEAVLANNTNPSLSELAKASLNTCTQRNHNENNQEEKKDTNPPNQSNAQHTPDESREEINQASEERSREPFETPATPWIQELSNPDNAHAALEATWLQATDSGHPQSSTSDFQASRANAEPWAEQTAPAIAPDGASPRLPEETSSEKDLPETTAPALETQVIDPSPTETNHSPDKKEIVYLANKDSEENLENLKSTHKEPTDEAHRNPPTDDVALEDNSQLEDPTHPHEEELTESDQDRAEKISDQHFTEANITTEEEILEELDIQATYIELLEPDTTSNEDIPEESTEEYLEQLQGEDRSTQLEIAETTDTPVLEATNASLETDASLPNYALGDLVVELPPSPPFSASENRPQQPQERSKNWKRFFQLKRP
ncbi:MAG: hypothetical protein EBS81_11035 [Gammaproteobacteria bacterium]|nr:hypothetical protein [Gammaproteobacteria bacterium]